MRKKERGLALAYLMSILRLVVRISERDEEERQYFTTLSPELSLALDRVKFCDYDLLKMANKEDLPVGDVIAAFEDLLSENSPIRQSAFESYVSKCCRGWWERRCFLGDYYRLQSAN